MLSSGSCTVCACRPTWSVVICWIFHILTLIKKWEIVCNEVTDGQLSSSAGVSRVSRAFSPLPSQLTSPRIGWMERYVKRNSLETELFLTISHWVRWASRAKSKIVQKYKNRVLQICLVSCEVMINYHFTCHIFVFTEFFNNFFNLQAACPTCRATFCPNDVLFIIDKADLWSFEKILDLWSLNLINPIHIPSYSSQQ